MENNKINICINRTKNISAENKIPITKEDIVLLENQLNVVLPNDFKKICAVCSYEFISYIFHNFPEDVILETIALRERYNLPHEYIVLESTQDPGPILLKTESIDRCQVILCSHYDFRNICSRKPCNENPTIFISFTDFYEFLLDAEEKA